MRNAEVHFMFLVIVAEEFFVAVQGSWGFLINGGLYDKVHE